MAAPPPPRGRRRSRTDEALGTAASSLQTSLRIAESALRGAPAIVRPGGTATSTPSRPTAPTCSPRSTWHRMAYVAVVAGPDRPRFEAPATGLTIQDQGADGLVPAAPGTLLPDRQRRDRPPGHAGQRGVRRLLQSAPARRGGRGRGDGRRRPDGAVRRRAERPGVRVVVPRPLPAGCVRRARAAHRLHQPGHANRRAPGQRRTRPPQGRAAAGDGPGRRRVRTRGPAGRAPPDGPRSGAASGWCS
jgi:hypothetical protein